MAERVAQAALKVAEKHVPGSLDVALIVNILGIVADMRGEPSAAEDHFRRGLEIREKHAPGSLEVAQSLNNLAIVARHKGDLNAAMDFNRRALEIREERAPGAVEVAGSLNNLGLVALDQEEFEIAEGYLRRALEVHEKLAPDSLDAADCLGNLGSVSRSRGDSLNGLGGVAWKQGDLEAADRFHRRALEIRTQRAPGSLAVAFSLDNLGIVAAERGDLQHARDLFQRALQIKVERAPDSTEVAGTLHNLSAVAQQQGDFEAAENRLRRALEIQEKRAPGSLDVALSLESLGVVSRRKGNLEAAERYLRRALAIKQKHAPDSLEVARTLGGLGTVEMQRDAFEAARGHHRRALEIEQAHAPGSIDVAHTLNNLGLVAKREGSFQVARDHFRRALEIKKEHAPGSLSAAVSLSNLGLVARIEGKLEEAEGWFGRAWAIVSEQRSAVVGDEAGRAFTARHSTYATNLIEVRLARGETVAAFDTLEQSRARGLLQLASERGLIPSDVEAGLWERLEAADDGLEFEAGRLSKASANQALLEHEVHAREAAGASESDLAAMRGKLAEAAAQREQALSAYTSARLEKEHLLGEVRRQVPGLEPRKFSLDEARRALPGNSVFVAYSVGEEESALFVIPSDPERAVQARTIGLGEAELGSRVAALREQIGVEGAVRAIGGLAQSKPVRPVDEELVAAARALFDDLFPEEARAAIDAAQRLIVSPDGPLWELPFAALVTNASGETAWLGLERRLTYTPSLTVLVQERERRPGDAASTGEALVVGDPVFASDAGSTQSDFTVLRGERSHLTAGGAAPARLPATAVEARRVAALYGTQPLLGQAATEAAVREKLPYASIVHLATHGYFHPYLAMSSGVLLAPSSRETTTDDTDDDGALQAWEFGTGLPLQADLVVLSACETGRGETARGEGLVGLTRSLQAAGARSVVATHWKIADEATADLMVTFHETIHSGVPMDEALRQAMRRTAAREQTAHPFYWAAFFLTGDPGQPLRRPGATQSLPDPPTHGSKPARS